MPRWTPEARTRQAAAIRRWEPWRKSTGPKTLAGKERSSINALKTGEYDGEIGMLIGRRVVISPALLRRVPRYKPPRK